jgi:hypothetical protein
MMAAFECAAGAGAAGRHAGVRCARPGARAPRFRRRCGRRRAWSRPVARGGIRRRIRCMNHGRAGAGARRRRRRCDRVSSWSKCIMHVRTDGRARAVWCGTVRRRSRVSRWARIGTGRRRRVGRRGTGGNASPRARERRWRPAGLLFRLDRGRGGRRATWPRRRGEAVTWAYVRAGRHLT